MKSILVKLYTIITLALFASITAQAQLLPKELRVSTYNVQGLPWPIHKNKKVLMYAIGNYLKVARSQGTAPHILVLQEAFIKDAAEIIKRSGYPYFVKGPTSKTVNSDDLKKCLEKGEQPCGPGAKYVSSGLYIVSEFPIIQSAHEVFGQRRCAGWDCYSNKGVMYARIQVPGILEPIQILNTHMQANGSSGSSKKNIRRAQLNQLSVIQKFMARNVNFEQPVIFPGDFNIRTTQPETFADMMKALPFHNVGLYCNDPQYSNVCKIKDGTDPLSLHASPDHHFWRASKQTQVVPILAEKNMDHYFQDRPFSDHLAYEVTYLFY